MNVARMARRFEESGLSHEQASGMAEAILAPGKLIEGRLADGGPRY